jgi:hypothetical protein
MDREVAMDNTTALWDATLFGLPTLQSWDDLTGWEAWFGKHDVRTIVELGTYHGGLSCFFLLMARQMNIPFWTFDAIAYEGLNSPAVRSLGLAEHFIQADIFGDGKEQVLDILRCDDLHPLLLYCDDGNKPREFQTFVPHLRPGDFVAVHDVGDEFLERDITPLEGLVKRVDFDGGGLTGVWQRIPEPRIEVSPGDRCVLVLGVGRSGTSAAAGCLHHLGVNMGERLIEASRSNAYGTFEDAAMYEATRRVLAGSVEAGEVYPSLIAERREANRLWGVKHPALISVLEHILLLLGDVRVVVAERPRAECINSYMRAYHLGRAAAEKFYTRAFEELPEALALLEEKAIPTMRVPFHVLLEDPDVQVRRMVAFAFEGMEPPGEDEIEEAIATIDRKNRGRVMMGWGNLAVGVRVAKHPEPGFFADWTALLTGGLRSGDTVLMPRAHMPAHWASNDLAQDFLKSDQDTLLLIDDDMEFAMSTAHRLRENVANWEYDVVTAITARRSWNKISMVVMRLMDQAPAPFDLMGDHFEGSPAIPSDGEVVEVDALGLAFTFIRRHVLEAMVNEEWGVEYTYDFFTYGPGKESDDIPFCRRCRELGFRMAVDTSVRIGHFTAVPLGWQHWEGWLAAQAQAALGEHVVDLTVDNLKPILEYAVQAGDGVGEQARQILEAIASAGV